MQTPGQVECKWVVKPMQLRNWILGADITSFFDEIDHEWMLMFLGHRIADRRLLGLICKWLQAGFIEDGRRVAATKGTPQGAVISPLLASICKRPANSPSDLQL